MQWSYWIAILAMILVLSNPVGADSAQKPIALHPTNPHYFIWRGEPTILITSGEHYGALLNLVFRPVPRVGRQPFTLHDLSDGGSGYTEDTVS